MDRPVTFSIGEAAKASDLSVKTIRYYEEIGLIPKAGRTNGGVHTAGHRLYTEADVGRLKFIHHARLFGLSLADIREMVALAQDRGCPSRQPEYQQILRRHLHEIDQRIRHLMGLRTAIEDLISPVRQPAGRKCTWDTCGCMRPAERAQSSRASHPEKFESKEETMCEFCGCSTGRSSVRRAPKGKALDVRIVAVGRASQARPAREPAQAARASIARSHPGYPDRTEA
ncbi:MAG: MerR family DNA-binding protein [Burkholderiales bacterium]|nr:MerR family DNA-binding protein [Burkholderiales bacterium]